MGRQERIRTEVFNEVLASLVAGRIGATVGCWPASSRGTRPSAAQPEEGGTSGSGA